MKKKSGEKNKHFGKNYLRLILILPILGLFFFAAAVIYFSQTLPPPSSLDGKIISQSTKIYDRSGQVLLYEIYDEEKRTVIPFEDIPEVVKMATIAIEDESFYSHPAFDIKGIIRAFITGVLRGRFVQGGSTITQQLAKNAFLTPEHSLRRKIKELILAYRIEKIYSKDEILALYLNQIPYGHNSYGIEAASQTFFNKSATDLSLSEAAMLAALPRAPSYYSPWGSHTDELERRRVHILKRMYQLGFIDETQLEDAIQNKPRVVSQPIKADFSLAPHFVLMVQNYLNQKYGEDFVRRAGLKVTTTLDVELQKIANLAVKEGAKRNTELYEGHNAALVAEDPSTGQILALVGSKDYSAPSEPEGCLPTTTCRFEGNFNAATQGLRQPGSAFKPFGYLMAFMTGLTPDTIVFDVPTEFTPNQPACPALVDFSNTNPLCYHPRNFDERFRGPISLKEALAQSINVPSVKALYLAGINSTIDLAEKFGITTLKDRSRLGLSLILGGGEVRLTELVNAYSVLAQEGIKRDQVFILKVEDADGRVWEEFKDNPRRVVDAEYPRLINDILSDSRLRQPLFQASLRLTEVPGYQVALKTGTTNDYVDAWAIGYTPNLVAGVWVGNNNNEPLKKYGGSILAAVPIWHDFMSQALRYRPAQTFNKPSPIPVTNPILAGEFDPKNAHNILHYLNRLNDPQYKNWEEAVIYWLKNNPLPAKISEPMYSYTAEASPFMPSQQLITFPQYQTSGNINLEIISPKNGDFVGNQQIHLTAKLSADSPINKIEVYFNRELIESAIGDWGNNYVYQLNFQPPKMNLQNSLVVRVTTQTNEQSSKEIIVFK